MKVTESLSPTKYLDTFDAKLEKFNLLSDNTIPLSLAIVFLKTATNGNTNLLHNLTSCETITERFILNATPTYNEYYELLMFHPKKLEDSVTDNSLSWKVNVAESDYM